MPYRKPTGTLLKVVRPDIYRQMVDLLAEPREHVSYREIARVCGVGGNTIKAVERAEAETIQDLKRKLAKQSMRVAQRALNRIEDGIDSASVAVAVPVYGVCVEKTLLLSGEATARIELNHNLTIQDAYSEFLRIAAEIRDAVKPLPSPTPCLEAEIVAG
ncbi:MAG TPA: hypothetical protein VGI60_02645 [Chthoniobacterales bacterium]|jgi:nucleotidyltransferase/DNA polymerase involved in DNA repair